MQFRTSYQTLLQGLIGMVFLSTSLYAQNPGFAGKHFQVYALIEPSMAGPVPAGYTNDILDIDETYFREAYAIQRDLTIKFPIGVGMEYTINQSVTLGTNFRYAQNEVYFGQHFGYFPDAADDEKIPVYAGEVACAVYLNGWYIKLYTTERSGSIAPIGRYNKLEFIHGWSQASAYGFHTVDESLMDPLYAEAYYLVDNWEALNISKSRAYFLRYTYGGEKVYFNNFACDMGIQFTLNLSNYVGVGLFGGDSPVSYEDGGSFQTDAAFGGMILGLIIHGGFFAL